MFITVTDQLFVSSLGGELTQYDLDTLEPIRTFGGSRGHVFGGAGTADGTLVAISGGDHRVVLYDIASGARIGTPITVPEGQENKVRISLDGKWMALGGERVDNTTNNNDPFQLWSLQPEELDRSVVPDRRTQPHTLTSGTATSATSPTTGPRVRNCPSIPDLSLPGRATIEGRLWTGGWVPWRRGRRRTGSA